MIRIAPRIGFVLALSAIVWLLSASPSAATVYLPTPNLVSNAGFESGTAGWLGNNASIGRSNLVTPAAQGAYYATVTSTGSSDFTIDDDPDTVDGNVKAGMTYSGRVWVRGTASSDGEVVELILREWQGGSELGRNTAETILENGVWKRIDVSRTAAATGNIIDLYVARPSGATIGEVFHADAFSLVSDAILPGHLAIDPSSNPTFETNTSRWVGVAASLAQVSDGAAPHGEFVSRVLLSGSPQAYALDDSPSLVSNTEKGFSYQAKAWVKGNSASNGDPLQLQIRERTPGGTLVGTTTQSVNLSSSNWTQVSASRTPATTGNKLELYLARPAGTVTTGDGFFADAVSMRLDDSSSCPGQLGTFVSSSSGTWPTACWRPYGAASPFNDLLPAAPVLSPDSADIINRLMLGNDSARPDHIVPGPDPWKDSGSPTYYPSATDPLYTIDCVDFGGSCDLDTPTALQVRIPAGATPEGGRFSAPPFESASASGAFGTQIPNPSFESSTSGWASYLGSVSRVTNGTAPDGSYVAQVQPDVGATGYTLDSSEADAHPGDLYTARAWVRAANVQTSGQPLRLYVREFDSDYNVLSETFTATNLSASQWKTLETTLATSSNARYVDAYLLRDYGTVVSGDLFLADAIHMVKWQHFDAHMTIVDQASGWEYDFFNVRDMPVGGGTIKIGFGGRTRIGTDGDGLGSDGVAAQYGNLAGLIRGAELQAGVINHALNMYLPCTEGPHVYPAGKSDKICSVDMPGYLDPPNTAAAPMGARFQLDMPDWEIDALPVEQWKKTVLRALAHHGAYVADTTLDENAWGFEIEGGWTYRSFGRPNPFETLAAGISVIENGKSDYNLNAPCPTPSLVYPIGASECSAYGASADPLNTQKDEYYFQLDDDANPIIDWSRLRVVDPCEADNSC